MSKRALIAVVALVVLAPATLAFATSRSSGVGPIALGPFHGSGLAAYGCGGPFANYSSETRYQVYPRNADGSVTVLQAVTGAGKTVAGSSPGSCRDGTNATIAGGIPATLDGIDIRTISGAAFHAKGNCASPCYFSQFIQAFFGPGATDTAEEEYDRWTTACNGTLLDLNFGTPNQQAVGDIAGPKHQCD
jgi:hypothetical protein